MIPLEHWKKCEVWWHYQGSCGEAESLVLWLWWHQWQIAAGIPDVSSQTGGDPWDRQWLPHLSDRGVGERWSQYLWQWMPNVQWQFLVSARKNVSKVTLQHPLLLLLMVLSRCSRYQCHHYPSHYHCACPKAPSLKKLSQEWRQTVRYNY